MGGREREQEAEEGMGGFGLEPKLMKWSHPYSGCVFLSQSPNKGFLTNMPKLVFEVMLDSVKLKPILLHTLFKMLAGIQNAITIMNNDIVVIQNIENSITLQTSNSTSKYILKITKSRIRSIFDPAALFTVSEV